VWRYSGRDGVDVLQLKFGVDSLNREGNDWNCLLLLTYGAFDLFQKVQDAKYRL
jgi:hypothetical protein